MAGIEAQRLCWRMLQTGEQALWLGMKLKGYAIEYCRLIIQGFCNKVFFREEGGQKTNWKLLTPPSF